MVDIQINGTSFPIAPITYEIGRADLDSEDSGRSAETGVMIRYPIRKGVFKIELTFRGTAAQIKSIENLVVPTSFSVTFPYLGDTWTKTMYAGDRAAAKVRTRDDWWDFSVNLIEY